MALPKMPAMRCTAPRADADPQEPDMHQPLSMRSLSLVLAMAVTLSILGGIHSLAAAQTASAQWAAAATCARG